MDIPLSSDGHCLCINIGKNIANPARIKLQNICAELRGFDQEMEGEAILNASASRHPALITDLTDSDHRILKRGCLFEAWPGVDGGSQEPYDGAVFRSERETRSGG